MADDMKKKNQKKDTHSIADAANAAAKESAGDIARRMADMRSGKKRELAMMGIDTDEQGKINMKPGHLHQSAKAVAETVVAAERAAVTPTEAFYSALIAVQSKLGHAVRDSNNPTFQHKYASLASVLDTCRPLLTENGFAVIQVIIERNDHPTRGDAGIVGPVLVTRLIHKAGHVVESTIALRGNLDDPQAVASAITYARRYSLAALVGVAQTDDDAETTMGKQRRPGDGNKTDKSAVVDKFLDPADFVLNAGNIKDMKLKNIPADSLKAAQKFYTNSAADLSSLQKRNLDMINKYLAKTASK